MATLKTDYKDYVADGDKKYRVTANADGTSGIADATTYSQTGDTVGAADLNAINAAINTMWSTIYPVGSIYMSTTLNYPAQMFGGTWVQLKDRFLLGAGDTYGIGDTGGNAYAALTADNNGPHTHLTVLNASGSGDGWGPSGAYASGAFNTATTSQGSGTPFSIMPPYLVVYMWVRTA